MEGGQSVTTSGRGTAKPWQIAFLASSTGLALGLQKASEDDFKMRSHLAVKNEDSNVISVRDNLND